VDGVSKAYFPTRNNVIIIKILRSKPERNRENHP